MIFLSSLLAIEFPRVDSSTNKSGTESSHLFEMEDSREATTKICLPASRHFKWSDLLPLFAQDADNHYDKCELLAWPSLHLFIGLYFSLKHISFLSEMAIARHSFHWSGKPWRGLYQGFPIQKEICAYNASRTRTSYIQTSNPFPDVSFLVGRETFA